MLTIQDAQDIVMRRRMMNTGEDMFESTLLYMWAHADIAYREPNGSEGLFKDAKGFFFRKTALDFCYLVKYSDHAILSFRGTDTEDNINIALIKRWIRNLNVRPLVVDGGTIHRGFYEAWKSLKISVRKMVEKVDTQLFITGHSLGADLAYLAARDLVKNCKLNHNDITCMPFAPAGLFTKKGMDEYDGLDIKTTYVINGYDIIESVPVSLVRPGLRSWLYQNPLHMITSRIKDHLPRSYTKAVNDNVELFGG